MLRELRELAHGIHPPVLSDNGLVAALESRVARFPISVQILADDDLRAERFPEDVEGTAYFVACESLTNVAKHAGTDDARSGYRIRADDSASLSKTTVGGSSRTVPVPAGWPTSVTASRRCTASSRSKAGWAPEQASVPNYHFTRRPQVRMSDKLRVVIAEDNYLVREGVRRLLEDSGEIEVVACVGDARELLDAVRRTHPRRGSHRYPHASRSPYGGHRGCPCHPCRAPRDRRRRAVAAHR